MTHCQFFQRLFWPFASWIAFNFSISNSRMAVAFSLPILFLNTGPEYLAFMQLILLGSRNMAASVVFKSFILLKFPQTFLVAYWCNRFEVKSFQLVDCCCVVLNKLNSHCWSCSVKIQAWKIPCVCVRPQDREMAACVSLQVIYIAKISTDLSRCMLAQSLRS